VFSFPYETTINLFSQPQKRKCDESGLIPFLSRKQLVTHFPRPCAVGSKDSVTRGERRPPLGLVASKIPLYPSLEKGESATHPPFPKGGQGDFPSNN